MRKEQSSERDFISNLLDEKGVQLLGAKPITTPLNQVRTDKAAIGPFIVPNADKADIEDTRKFLRQLRAFYRTGKEQFLADYIPDHDTFSALLSPFKHQELPTAIYPLWLFDERDDRNLLQPLKVLLQTNLQGLFPAENQAIILKDNRLRLELLIAKRVHQLTAEPLQVLRSAGQDLLGGLQLQQKDAETLRQDLDILWSAFPRKGSLLPYSRHAVLQILQHVLTRKFVRKQNLLNEIINPLITRLQEMITVEELKSDEATSSESLAKSMDFASDFIQFDQFSDLVVHDHAYHMPAERLQRLRDILSQLESAEKVIFHKKAQIIVSASLKTFLEGSDGTPLHDCQLTYPSSENFVKDLQQHFQNKIQEVAGVFAAINMAQLEVEDAYRSDIHRDFFSLYDWHAFSEQEWQFVPPFISIITHQEWRAFGDKGLAGFAETAHPVKMIILHTEAQMHFDQRLQRTEPALQALVQRHAFILQATPMHARLLSQSFFQALDNGSPGLFYILNPTANMARSDQYWVTAAAVESRAFPCWKYDHQQHKRWGSRFAIDENPAVDQDWPLHHYKSSQNGEIVDEEHHLTFTDYLSGLTYAQSEFRIIPPAFWTDDLQPLEKWLNEEDHAPQQIPFIWGKDDEDHLCRLVPSRRVVLQTYERKEFWNFLQENAGIHNYHVEQALKHAEELWKQKTEEILREREQAHQNALDAAKTSAVEHAMDKLASQLLNLDLESSLTAKESPLLHQQHDVPSVDINTQSNREETIAPKEQLKEDEPPVVEVPDEAWIETALCTSCNECTDRNSKIFKYNAQKQAYIDDPTGGPFSDIVLAAENCPVKIIHPGSPHNPNEEHLEEWIERAKPYN